MSAGRVAGLDGLRGLAILLVLVSHGAGLLTAGLVGVLVFFVLSGYLITSLLIAEHDRAGHVDLRAFYLRRGLRLFPALVALLVLFALTPLWRALDVSWGDVALGVPSGMFYLTDLTLGLQLPNPAPLAHLWSLAVEEQFYLVWPVALLALLRLPLTARLTWLPRILVAAALLRLVVMALSGPLDLFFYALPTTWADCLLLGAALALVRRDSSTLWDRLGAWVARPALVHGAVGVLLVTACVAPAYWSPLTYAIGLPILAASTGVLIVAVASQSRVPALRLLRTRPARWLGDHSYSLYLYNSFSILLLQRVIGAGLGQRLLGLALAVVLAVASRRLVEEPFLRLKDRIGRPRPRPVSA